MSILVRNIHFGFRGRRFLVEEMVLSSFECILENFFICAVVVIKLTFLPNSAVYTIFMSFVSK